MAEQVEVIALEVEARGGHSFEGVGVIEGIVRVSFGGKKIVSVIGVTPFLDMGNDVLQVGDTVACRGEGIVAQVGSLHFGIIG